MKTIVYYVRHAKPIDEWDWHYDQLRPLTSEGENDAAKLSRAEIFNNIDVVFCSPSARAVNTIKYIAERNGLPINIKDDLRERKYGTIDYELSVFREKQWNDFNYKVNDGESLSEVEDRNINVLKDIISNNLGKKILISGHAMSLSTILHFFNPNFSFNDFNKMGYCAIYKLEFDNLDIKNIEQI